MTADPPYASPGSVNPEVLRNNAIWSRRTVVLITALFAWRVAYLAICPLELCPDEAYYWDWSRQLDLGYYSKPPMIAWLIGLATRIGGPSEFTVRFPAACLGSLGLWPVYRLARQMFDARVGFWSVAVVAATPGMAAMSLLMTIDAPFLCAWSFAVWCVWELCDGDRPRACWLVPAILATGAGLLSKQTMFAIFPLTLLWFALDRQQRHKLASPTIWLWIIGSLLCLTPVVWWNQQHGWITAQHTREHFQSQAVGARQHVVWFLEFWGSQFGVLSPVTCAFAMTISIAGLWSLRTADRRIRYLLCLGAVPLLAVGGLSTMQRVQPNWPAAFHLTSLVLAAAWGSGAISFGAMSIPRVWFPRGIIVGGALALSAYVVPFVVPGSSLAGGPLDATARLRGWRVLAQGVGAELAAETPLVIAATGRGPVSTLAYYLPERPHVYRWNRTGVVESQHEIWGGVRGHEGKDAVIVTHGGVALPAELAAAFDIVTPGELVSCTLGNARQRSLQIWHGRGFRRWPEPMSKNDPTAHRPQPATIESASRPIEESVQ